MSGHWIQGCDRDSKLLMQELKIKGKRSMMNNFTHYDKAGSIKSTHITPDTFLLGILFPNKQEPKGS